MQQSPRYRSDGPEPNQQHLRHRGCLTRDISALIGNFHNHVSAVCVGGCLRTWACATVSNEDREGGLLVHTLTINIEVLLALNTEVLLCTQLHIHLL